MISHTWSTTNLYPNAEESNLCNPTQIDNKIVTLGVSESNIGFVHETHNHVSIAWFFLSTLGSQVESAYE